MTSTSIYTSVIPVIHSKTCNKCDVKHSVGEFYNDKKSKDGFRATCKSCLSIHSKQYHIDKNNFPNIIYKKGKSNTLSNFIDRAILIHGNIYDYSETVYTRLSDKVDIICSIHGIFSQKANNHLQGRGCIKCSRTVSKISNNWLKSLNISDLLVEHRLPENLRKAVDGYSPSTNTVYQFHGDFWHGNPLKYKSTDMNKCLKKTYGELYEKTIESDLWILSLGYNLVTMWESEFNQII